MKEEKKTINEILKDCKIEDGILKLPEIQLDRKIYLEIAKKLNFLGGKWKRNKKGFVFDRDITLKEIIENTETKKDIQFFETPPELADYLVELCEIDNNHTTLEPSAGRGSIIKAIRRKYSCPIYYYEISETNRKYLDNIKDIVYLGNDFIIEDEKKFERIIANPPFSKNKDIQHIKKMYERLENGGILVSIASKHWEFAGDKKSIEFRKFLKNVKAEIKEIENGVFKDSGTMVGAKIIKIKKPDLKYN